MASDRVPSMDDEQVMAGIQEGRVEMLSILFERHHVRLYNFFLRLTHERDLSEDLVQEAFLRILKYSDSFRQEAKFATWMYQIARNLHIDCLRKTRPQVPLEEIEDSALIDHTEPVDGVQKEQEQKLLQRALARLPLKKRETLLLSRFQGMKYTDIAIILGCSVQSVKVLVHRSLNELRRIYLELSGGLS